MMHYHQKERRRRIMNEAILTLCKQLRLAHVAEAIKEVPFTLLHLLFHWRRVTDTIMRISFTRLFHKELLHGKRSSCYDIVNTNICRYFISNTKTISSPVQLRNMPLTTIFLSYSQPSSKTLNSWNSYGHGRLTFRL